jgi:hypothetical protein
MNETTPVKTKKNARLDLLGHVEKIVTLSGEKGLTDEFFEKARASARFVAGKLCLTGIQAIIFSHFVNKSDDQCIEIKEIAESLKCSRVKIIQYMDEIDVLEGRRLVRCSRDRDRVYYRVPREVIEALRHGHAYRPVDRKNLSHDQFFLLLDDLFSEKKDGELTFDALVSELDALLEDNRHLETGRLIESYRLDVHDRVILLVFCHALVNKDDDNIIVSDFESIFDKYTLRRVRHQLIEKKSELFTRRLIETVNDNGFEAREAFRLTDRAKEELLRDENLKERQGGKQKKNLISCASLAPRQMYYNEKEQAQIEQLAALLGEENFNGVRQRLRDKGMRAGFACLFHGGPGTGKTETVYQIARETGRDIMLVDISRTKSCWFGESEKKIKEIFDSYKSCVKSSDRVPILLFNEADAVIGKRKDVTSGNVAQTENAIQNIILQEMENLDGIMIATTNLTRNLDKAFERRFLYKIEFGKPSIEAKSAIWQSILPALSRENAVALANRFDFSGGQIENVARKCTVDSIISGEEPGFDALLFHCQNELLAKKSCNPVGFNA